MRRSASYTTFVLYDNWHSRRSTLSSRRGQGASSESLVVLVSSRYDDSASDVRQCKDTANPTVVAHQYLNVYFSDFVGAFFTNFALKNSLAGRSSRWSSRSYEATLVGLAHRCHLDAIGRKFVPDPGEAFSKLGGTFEPKLGLGSVVHERGEPRHSEYSRFGFRAFANSTKREPAP